MLMVELKPIKRIMGEYKILLERYEHNRKFCNNRL